MKPDRKSVFDPTSIDPYLLPAVSLLAIDSLPETSGVYFAIDYAGIQYIGKSKNIRQRWRNHHILEYLPDPSNTRISYYGCDCGRLSAMEQACIYHFRPKLNDKIKRPKVLKAKALPTASRQYRRKKVPNPFAVEMDFYMYLVEHALDVGFLSEEQRTILRSRFFQAFSAEVLKQLALLQSCHVAPDLATLSIRDLKDKAKAAKLPGYSTMTKPELVAALAKVGSAHPTATLQADRA